MAIGKTERRGRVVANGGAKESSNSDQWDAPQYHKVKKGDTLWKIAEYYYGDGSLYTKIFEAKGDIRAMILTPRQV